MNRKRIMGIATAAILAGTAATAAFAQSPPSRGPEHRDMRQSFKERMCADAPARMAGWLAYGEVKLGITAEQRTAWQAFAQDVRKSAQPMLQRCNEAAPKAAAAGKPPAPDAAAALARREQELTTQLESVKTLHAAVEKLTPVLNAQQKTELAQLMSPRFGHGMFGPDFGPGRERGPAHEGMRGHERGPMMRGGAFPPPPDGKPANQ